MADWFGLLRITRGEPFSVERIHLQNSDIHIEGDFEVPQLFSLPPEDLVFAAAFIKCHGSIKKMESMFDISYPTVKNRLNRIGERLQFVDVTPEKDTSNVLDELASGDISVDEALERLNS